MGADSKIEWTHHTLNPWWGCVKVSPACKNCYAESFAKRTGHKVWGGTERRFFGANHFKEPLRWERDAREARERHRVFCASMADIFELVDDRDTAAKMAQARARVWDLVELTPNLDWLLLTKRPENILGMVPWGNGRFPKNVWLGATAENQEWADARIPHLIGVDGVTKFVSCEPLLGALDLTRYLKPELETNDGRHLQHPQDSAEIPGQGGSWHWGLDLVICGGESGGRARPMHADWARALRDQCVAHNVAFHFKQWGEHDEQLIRIGKKKAGRLLDGRPWDEMPGVRARALKERA